MNLLPIADDVSPDFSPNRGDSDIMSEILPHEATAKAIRLFSYRCARLSDYGYWFMLGTLWVSYSGHSDLALWRRLLSSNRPRRDTSLMKPSELRAFRALPDTITVYRAHRTAETDWIAYTIAPVTAARFARERAVSEVTEYRIAKADALCLFLRRGEFEVIALDRTKAQPVRTIPVVLATPPENRC